MNNLLFIYLLKLNIVFSIFYIIYLLALRKTTFHKLNRFSLLLAIPLSVIIAGMDNSISIETSNIEVPSFIELGNSFHNDFAMTPTHAIDSNHSEDIPILKYLYIFGVIIMISNLLMALLEIITLKKEGKTLRYNKYVFIFSKKTVYFSFFNWIFIPTENLQDSNNVIIEHEKQHVNFRHTFDLIIVETFISFLWFNPLVYFYRKSLKVIHEYQVDRSLLVERDIDCLTYLEVLRQEIKNNNRYNLYSYFNNSNLKLRIEMMTKIETKERYKLIYLILVPIIFLFLFSFTKVTRIDSKISQSKQTFAYPINNASKDDITHHFGLKQHPILKVTKHHEGIDFETKMGTPIIASEDGVIIEASRKGIWGKLVIIQHKNGIETHYAHLQKISCKKHQKIKKGQLLGYSGSTGRITKPTLHYAIKDNGKFINPLGFLE